MNKVNTIGIHPKVSVIIPCYNIENYIRQCIDSILQQTLQDFEIICVDDGSSDQTLAILSNYATENSNITVLQQNNLYAGVARNKGLSVAKGEYVIFLDGDDFFDPQLLELACAAGDKNQADIVLFGYRRFDEKKQAFFDKEELPRYDLISRFSVFSARDIPNDIFRITTPAPWTKLYRNSFLADSGLQFQPLPNSNDFFFTLSSLAMAERICTVQKALTFYRVNMPNSIQGLKHKSPLCFLSAVDALYKQLNDTGMYSMLKNAFRTIALSTTHYNITSASTVAARHAILEALDTESFRKYDLLGHDADFYACSTAHLHATTILSAVNQYRITKSASDIISTDAVIPCRSNHPVYVSVIIPVFNTAEYLDETLSSICHQTLEEIEIICINDGSTDHSLEILQQWALKDPRISVWTQPNSGLSRTRNAGIRIAQGRYIYFMDSDDILEVNALETLFNKASNDNLDIIYFDAVTFLSDSNVNDDFQKYRNSYARSRAYDQIYKGSELFHILYTQNEYYPSACLQMLRREYVLKNNIFFRPCVIHEDNAFTFSSILQADRVSHIKETFFHRRMRQNSIVTSTTSFKNSYGYFASYQDMLAAYLKIENTLADEVKSSALARIGQNLVNAQDAYRNMPKEQKGSELGLGADYRYFERIVIRAALIHGQHEELKVKYQRIQNENAKTGKRNIQILNDEILKLKTENVLLKKQTNDLSKYMPKQPSRFMQKIRRAIQCCKDHGIRYTIRHAIRKLLK